ncbi:BPSL0067 family protein [Acidovorax sp. Leaf78]|uniref:BPSL0067 family protein n=1 Tax=unclassified Acidovorax TaxID=2684926 RepID=UPI000700953B|nr:BPSL0067 family protein [Acidovorax sp. Leaf78]KQO16814.1 hypothetical protein ASF16_12995 [Acidovorax sp. Leaf78]
MSYIYENPESLVGKPLAGTHQCVALVKEYARAPATALWREGAAVKGNLLLKKGTVIATFVDGKYPNKSTGNHAALYVSQDASGITVVDQWVGVDGIQKRVLAFKGKDKKGNLISPSSNGDAFSVVD